MNWFKRLLDRSPAEVAPAAASATTPVELPKRLANPLQAVTSPGVRRPLVSASGEVAGFEFTLPAVANKRSREGNPQAHLDDAISLLQTMQPVLDEERIALICLPLQLLMQPELIDHLPKGAWLCLADANQPPSTAEEERQALLSALKACGVKVGLQLANADGAEAQLDDFDFVVIAAGPSGVQPQLQRLRQLRSQHPERALIVRGLPDVDAIERALAAGATLACGEFNSEVAAPKQRSLQGDVQRIIQLLNVVRDENRPLSDLTRELRGDVGLCYRLLRQVNSPAMGLNRSVESIEQAVLILGRSELYRWLSVLLLASVAGRPTSRALQEVSLARARFLELLARERGTDPPDALFTVGMLSLLNVMLEMPMPKALEPLRLSDSAHLALLDRDGPWKPMLVLSEAIERQDMDAAAIAAVEFGGLEHVLHLSDSAWRWARSVHRHE